MLLTLSAEEYTYATSFEEYENGTLYNWAKYSLSSHLNDRQYLQSSSNNNNNNKFLSLLYEYRDLRAKKHRDKNSLFALQKPADWSYHFFTGEKLRIDALIGYIIIFTGEQNRVARSPLLFTDKQHIF